MRPVRMGRGGRQGARGGADRNVAAGEGVGSFQLLSGMHEDGLPRQGGRGLGFRAQGRERHCAQVVGRVRGRRLWEDRHPDDRRLTRHSSPAPPPPPPTLLPTTHPTVLPTSYWSATACALHVAWFSRAWPDLVCLVDKDLQVAGAVVAVALELRVGQLFRGRCVYEVGPGGPGHGLRAVLLRVHRVRNET